MAWSHILFHGINWHLTGTNVNPGGFAAAAESREYPDPALAAAAGANSDLSMHIASNNLPGWICSAALLMTTMGRTTLPMKVWRLLKSVAHDGSRGEDYCR